jgi:hypothetical protein
MSNDRSPDDLRTVWQCQPSETISIPVEELRRASHKLTRRVFWRNTREYLAACVVVVGYGSFFFEFQTWLLRLGSALTVAGVLWIVFQLHKRGSAAPMAKEMDAQNCLDFHRAELVRQRDLHATVWKWYLLPFVPGMSLFLLGQLQTTLSRPGASARQGAIELGFAAVAGFCAVVFAVVGKLNRGKARKLQERIDALDALKGPSL